MPTGPGESTRTSATVTPLGGVRADFVANLGRRLSELRQHWASFEQDPGLSRARDEVRRRIHALTTRARLLEFAAMADRLDEASQRLDRAAASGLLDSEQQHWFHELFRTLPALAWNDVTTDQPMSVPSYELPQIPAPASHLAVSGFPLAVLVVGAEALRRALTEPGPTAGQVELECERTEDMQVALDLARALAPDLVVVDIDLQGARQFVEALAEDPLTEPVPVVVLGSWAHPDQAADLISLGIVRCLPKPVPPDLLRAAAHQAGTGNRRAPPELPTMGELTVEEVTERLVAQLRAGLVQAVQPETRNVKISLEKGTEILAAVWSAVARVRETLTIRSHGNVRFSASGPAGAVPMAPWIDETGVAPSGRRRAGRDQQEQRDKVRLDGRKILVVDDDPAITWFLSGLLRAAGAFVYEAHNGRKAIELAFRASPDLVISDLIMPELDGFGLCRELKRDIALRDAPVILLSWKEDLLQRVRELGARADGYLRKESTAPAILQRVYEVLQPRIRVESRLRTGTEVRGRLDGLTACTLLHLVGASLPDGRVTVRDAKFVYEIELRDGAPRSASRTAQDGSFARGPAVLVALLGIASGRFCVVPSNSPIRSMLQGDLVSQLNPIIARARAAQRLLSTEHLSQISSVKITADALTLDALPDNARALLEALHLGVAPQQAASQQRAPATLLEAILDDAAIHGAVEAIMGPQGTDLLEEQTVRMLEAMSLPARSSRRSQPTALATVAEAGSVSSPGLQSPAPDDAQAQPVNHTIDIRAQTDLDREAGPALHLASDRSSAPELIVIESEELADPATERAWAEGKPDGTEEQDDDDGMPTSLTEAVIREVLDSDGGSVPTPRPPPPMLDARELRPRSVRAVPAQIPSLPPNAIVPGLDINVDGAYAPEPSVPAAPSLPPEQPDQFKTPSSLRQPPLPEIQTPRTKSDRAPARLTTPERKPTGVGAVDTEDTEQRERMPRPMSRPAISLAQMDRDAEPTVPRESMAWAVIVPAAIVAGMIALGVWLRPPTSVEQPSPALSNSALGVVDAAAPTPPTSPVANPPLTGTPTATLSASPQATPSITPNGSSSSTSRDAPEDDLPLPVGSRLPKGFGLLEVRTQQPDAVVLADGRELGTGPVVAEVMKPGQHTVLVRWRGREIAREVTVREARRTRFTLVPP